MKYYAFYNSTEKTHELVSEKERNEIIAKAEIEKDYYTIDGMKWLTEFPNFRQAKKHCLECYLYDLMEIKSSIKELRKMRKGKE